MRAVGQRKFWQIPDIFGGKLVVWWQDKRWPGWRGSEWAGPLACARPTRHDLTHISGSAAGPTATIESDSRTVRQPQLLQCFSDATEAPYLVGPPKNSRSSIPRNCILASQNSWFKNFFIASSIVHSFITERSHSIIENFTHLNSHYFQITPILPTVSNHELFCTYKISAYFKWVLYD